MECTEDVVSNMKVARVFSECSKPINSMDFHSDGEWLVTASDDESLHLYQATEGRLHKVLHSKRYGVDLVRFTRNPHCVICASKNGWDETLRSWDIQQNRYVIYYKGHRSTVLSIALAMSQGDAFMSSSLDRTVRLWEERTNICQGILSVTGLPVVRFDPLGIIFAVSTDNAIRLYDLRAFDKGPFDMFLLPKRTVVRHLRFSADGKFLAAAAAECTYLLDAFSGDVVRRFDRHILPSATQVCEVSFTINPQYMLAGSESGNVHVYDTSSGNEIVKWQQHSAPVNCVQFNPKMLLAASASTDLALSLPSESTIHG